MTDQTDVREFLHRMANEAGFAPVEPGPVVRKARRRLARTVGGTLFMAGALVAGALVAANGLMNAARTQMPQPGGQPTPGTTENGQAVPVPYSFLDGEVTFAAAPPWARGSVRSDHGSTHMDLFLRRTYSEGRYRGPVGSFMIVADPLPVEPLPETGCEPGPAPADAEALARSIRSNHYFEATAPVAVSVGGIDALRMDVVGPVRSICNDGTIPQPTTGNWLGPGERMRLYVLDLPEGMSARILTIAIVVEKQDFEHVVEAAAPILDSFEFHTG
jgi:hypothetical protein